MKLAINNKWFEVSKGRSIEEQTDFLKDSLSLYSARPKNYILLFLALFTVQMIFMFNSSRLLTYSTLATMLCVLTILIYIFNVKLEKFKKKWFKNGK
jgi:hypothetical protein